MSAGVDDFLGVVADFGFGEGFQKSGGDGDDGNLDVFHHVALVVERFFERELFGSGSVGFSFGVNGHSWEYRVRSLPAQTGR